MWALPVRAMGPGLALALMAVALSVPALARGGPRAPTRLTYQRAASAGDCPDEETLRAGVAGRLGYEPFDDGAAASLAVTVAREGEVLEATIALTDPNTDSRGQRRLTSHRGDCVELAAAVELAVAMAIDPLGVAAPKHAPVDGPAPAALPPVQPTAPSAPDVVVISTPSSAHVALPRPQPVQPFGAQAAVGLIVAAGSAPATSVGGTLDVRIRRGRASLAVEGRADTTASLPLRVGGIETSLLTADLVPCIHHRIFAGCAVLAAGSLRARGTGLIDARQVSTNYLAVGARLEAELSITPALFVRAHGDVLAPMTNLVLRVSGEAVWSNPPLSAVLGLGAGLHFL